MQSLQWILFNCGMTIEPCLKFHAVPSQSQCMTCRSRSQDSEFFYVKSLQCQLLQSLWLIWVVFGMNGYNILKCFGKEKRISGELPVRRQVLISRTLHLLPYFLCANSEGSGERRLAWAFAGRLCDKYHNLMSWLIYTSYFPSWISCSLQKICCSTELKSHLLDIHLEARSS